MPSTASSAMTTDSTSDQLILVTGSEEDVVDALVDQLGTGLQWRRRMRRRQGDGIGCATSGRPGVDQDLA